MEHFKILGSIVFVLFFLNIVEARKGNCTALKKCDDCLSEKDCFWCSSSKECMEMTEDHIPNGCGVNWMYFNNCDVPGYVYVIVIPVVGVVVLIALGCFFYCYCCRCKPSKRGAQNEETRFHRKRMELKAKHEERRAERKLKTDEIRKKYGLDKNDQGGSSRYHQFENENPDA